MTEFKPPPLRMGMIAVQGPRERTKFAVPAWYSRKCRDLQAAVWKDEITDLEAAVELDLWHRVWFLTEPPC